MEVFKKIYLFLWLITSLALFILFLHWDFLNDMLANLFRKWIADIEWFLKRLPRNLLIVDYDSVSGSHLVAEIHSRSHKVFHLYQWSGTTFVLNHTLLFVSVLFFSNTLPIIVIFVIFWKKLGTENLQLIILQNWNTFLIGGQLKDVNTSLTLKSDDLDQNPYKPNGTGKQNGALLEPKWSQNGSQKKTTFWQHFLL